MKNNYRTITIVFLSFMLFVQLAFVLVPATQGLNAAIIKTNKSDYSPQETVYISGSNFLASHSVTLTLTGPTGFSTYTWTSITDDKGKLETIYSNGLRYGNFSLSATDGTNTATTTFHDFALASFTALSTSGKDPSQIPLLQGQQYQFILTATLPGNSGSDGVNVYVKPPQGPYGSTGVTIGYSVVDGANLGLIQIPPHSNSGTMTMTLSIASDATPISQPLTVTAYDNPGSGGTIVGAFTVTLHIDQALLIVATTGLPSASYPTNVNTPGGNPSAGTAYNGMTFQTWYPIDKSTGYATTGTISVDNAVSANGIQYVFSGWKLNGQANGTNSQHGSITIADSATLTAAFTSKPVTHFSVVASPSTITAGSSTSITVTALADDNTVISGYIGTIHFTTTDANAAVILPNDYTFTASDQGSHVFTNGVTLITVGSQTVTASDTVTSSLSGVSNSVSVSAASLNHITISPGTASIIAGGSQAYTATAFDSFGNSWSITASYSIEAGAMGSVTGNLVTATKVGSWTVTALFSDKYATATLTVTAASIYNLEIVPKESTVSAGTSQPYTTIAYDSFGNQWPVTAVYSCTDSNVIVSSNTVYSNKAGTYYITATYAGVTDTATLIVTGHLPTILSITLNPSSASVEAGDSIAFSATASDGYNTWQITNQVVWSIDESGDAGHWTQTTGTYDAVKAGAWTVRATLNDKSGTATLTVTHSTDSSQIESVIITPSQSTIEAGQTQTYVAIATDTYGNSWPVTAEISAADGWSISAQAGGSWTGATYSSEKAGDWTVTGTYQGVSGTASLTVTHSTDATKIDRIEASLDPSSVAAPETVTGTAIAYDIYGNYWDVSTTAVWSIPAGNDGGSWTNNVYTSNTAGIYSVQVFYEGVAGTAILTVTHATNIAYLDHIAASLNPDSVAAPGDVTGTAIAFDIFGNHWDISTVSAWSIPAGGDGGSWNNNIYTSHFAGAYNVQAEYEGKTATATLTVTHATDLTYLDHITANVDPTTIAAPGQITGTATAYDTLGNHWDISTATNWSIPAGSDGGKWDHNVYTSHTAGTYNIQADYGGKTATASITVTHATDQAYLDHIVMAPKTATINAGISQSYTATAYDTFGNSWTVDATYSCPNSNVTIAANSVHSNIAGSYTITATYSLKTDTATLTVKSNPALLDRIVITPTSSSVTAGTSQSYTVQAYDQYNNDLGDVTSTSAFTINAVPIGGHTVTENIAGIYSVTATYNGKSATATLTVISAQSSSTNTNINTTPIIVSYNVTFIENGLPTGQSWTITFNGITKTSKTPTIVFTNIAHGSYTWTTKTAIAGIEGTRYIASANNGTISLPNTKSVSVTYTTQYYLTIDSIYGNPIGQGWYNANSTATFGVDTQATDSVGTQYGFAGWTGTGAGSYNGQDATQTVTMNNAVTESATWEQASSLYTVAGSALIIFLLLLLALLLLWRRRKKKPQNNPAKELDTE